jgi:hypothetical protein
LYVPEAGEALQYSNEIISDKFGRGGCERLARLGPKNNNKFNLPTWQRYQDEMALFLWDEFGKHVTIQSISRALASVGSSTDCKGTKCRFAGLLSPQSIVFQVVPIGLRG